MSTIEDGSVAPARASVTAVIRAELAATDRGRESDAAEDGPDEGDDQRGEQELGAGRDRHLFGIPFGQSHRCPVSGS